MNESCEKCLHSNHHPFGISYVDNLCTGCYTHQEKNILDWNSRYEILLKLTKTIKSKSVSETIYDCIIPIRGVACLLYTSPSPRD